MSKGDSEEDHWSRWLDDDERRTVEAGGSTWNPPRLDSPQRSQVLAFPSGDLWGRLMVSTLFVDFSDVLSLRGSTGIPIVDICERYRVKHPTDRQSLVNAATMLCSRYGTIRYDIFGIRIMSALIRYFADVLRIAPSQELVDWISYVIPHTEGLDFDSDVSNWLMGVSGTYPYRGISLELVDTLSHSHFSFWDLVDDLRIDFDQARQDTQNQLDALLRNRELPEGFRVGQDTSMLALAKLLLSQLPEIVEEMQAFESEAQIHYERLRPDQVDGRSRQDLLRIMTLVILCHFSSCLTKGRKLTGNIAFRAAYRKIYATDEVRGDFGKLTYKIRELTDGNPIHEFWKAVFTSSRLDDICTSVPTWKSAPL